MRGIGEIAERLRRSTAHVFPGRQRSGSGVVWSADGLILTNAHVARTAEAEVELWDGRRFRASVIARDPRRDLAALRITAQGLEPAGPGDSAALRVGKSCWRSVIHSGSRARFPPAWSILSAFFREWAGNGGFERMSASRPETPAARSRMRMGTSSESTRRS